MNQDDRETCRTCKESIAEGAKRCPHCLTWQSKWAFEQGSPQSYVLSFGMLGLLFIGIFGGLWFLESIENEAPPNFGGSLIVEADQLFGWEDSETHYVVVLATALNSSSHAWERIHIQFDFFDTKNNRIDSWIDRDYDLVVPPKGEVRFRITRTAIRPVEDYSEVSIQVVSASKFSAFGK
jgi:hypothetical protein